MAGMQAPFYLKTWILMNKTFSMGKLFRFFCIFCLLSVCLKSPTQNVALYGNDVTYAGQEIVFNRFHDLISGEEEEIGSCIVDSSGNFKILCNVEGTTFIFSHLGIYKAFIYVEPDKKYEIILPERVDKSPEDKLNPYFVESNIQLGIANIDTTELNFYIRMFNDAYVHFYNKHVLNFVNTSDFSELNADIKKIEKPFANSINKYFNNYREYRYGILRLLANQKKVRSISEIYFKNRPVLYGNPAYMELFNQVYNKYFVFSGRTEEGKEIYNAINTSGSYSKLINSLVRNNNFYNDTILELVILKGVYNEFYDDNLIEQLLGRWISVEDGKSVVEFINNQKVDFYAGEKMQEADFRLEGDKLIVGTDEIFEYSIVEENDKTLILMFLPRGNLLIYKKEGID